MMPRDGATGGEPDPSPGSDHQGGASRRRSIISLFGPVSAGTLVLALCSYLTLVVAARILGAERYAPFAVVWTLVFIVGPGLFAPIEQEGARGIAASRALGRPIRRPVRRTLLRTAALSGVLIVVLLLTGGELERRLGLSAALVWALAVSLLGVGVGHACRGILAGSGRLRAYGAGLAAEGLLRIGGALALGLGGQRSAWLFAVLAGAPAGGGAILGALARGSPATAGNVEGREEPAEVNGRSTLPALVVAAISAQLLINVGPVAVAVLAGPEDDAAAGKLMAGLVLTRIPLLALAAGQTVLLPHLAGLVARKREQELRALMTRLVGGCFVVAVVGTLIAAAVGPAAVRLLFGPDFDLSALDMALLVVAVMAYCAAHLLGLALISQRRPTTLACCWLTGIAVALGVLVVLPGLVLRVEAALVAGCLVSALLTGRAALDARER
jgi:O-antigen/teichoic acid export membrane protein